jgi:hypothetical protein
LCDVTQSDGQTAVRKSTCATVLPAILLAVRAPLLLLSPRTPMCVALRTPHHLLILDLVLWGRARSVCNRRIHVERCVRSQMQSRISVLIQTIANLSTEVCFCGKRVCARAVARGHSSLLLLLELNDRINDKDCVFGRAGFSAQWGGVCVLTRNLMTVIARTRYFKTERGASGQKKLRGGRFGGTVRVLMYTILSKC